MNATQLEIATQIFESYFHLVSGGVLVAIFAFYLWFVLSFGPSFMKSREAFDVTILIRIYNVFQVFACIFIVTRMHQLGFIWKYLWVCEKFEEFTDLQKLEVKIGYWLFLSLRVVEFCETVFFVLKKKQKQASFLHIFHHIGSALMTWLFIVSNAELMGVYIAQINSYVHIIMYAYYFFSSFSIDAIQAVTKRVKPLITIIQLVQFGIIITHCVIAIMPTCGCGYFFHLQILNFIVLTILFSHFFIQSYFLKKEDPKGNYKIAQSTNVASNL